MANWFAVWIEVAATHDAENLSRALLVPYLDETEVPAYEIKCSCVGNEAMFAAFEWYQAQPEAREVWGNLPEAERRRFPQFRYAYRQRLDKERMQQQQAHPNYNRPDPTCEECAGTGKRMTTHNTNARCESAQFSRVVLVAELRRPLRAGALITADGVWHQRLFDTKRWSLEPAEAWAARLTARMEPLRYVAKWKVHVI